MRGLRRQGVVKFKWVVRATDSNEAEPPGPSGAARDHSDDSPEDDVFPDHRGGPAHSGVSRPFAASTRELDQFSWPGHHGAWRVGDILRMAVMRCSG